MQLTRPAPRQLLARSSQLIPVFDGRIIWIGERTRKDSPTADHEREWKASDLSELEDQLLANEARRRRVMKWFMQSTPLCLAGVAGFVYMGRSLRGTFWPLIPLAGVWASLVVASICTVHLWATWKVRRIIRRGIAEARQYIDVTAVPVVDPAEEVRRRTMG